MFSNSLTIPGCVSRCKCLSGPLLPPPRSFVVRTWRHLEVDPQFSARIQKFEHSTAKNGFRTSTYSHGSGTPKFLVNRAQHSCIYCKKGGRAKTLRHACQMLGVRCPKRLSCKRSLG